MVLETEGTVLRIERNSIHDGPGLRTVLFLKGCPLSCLWCSTPESHNTFLEKGYDPNRCTGCFTCAENCPSKAISIVDGVPKTDTSVCTNCFHCVDLCPQHALKGYGQVMTVTQAVEEICKDEIFFFHSGGGLTLSGGECFSQPEFSAAVLQQCCRRGIDTAVETGLFTSWQSIEPSLPFLNSLYVDLKHHDNEKHQELVGIGNHQILANLKRLDESSCHFKLHLRIPLVPGINDDDKNISALLALGTSLTKLTDVEILPYHRLGVTTYSYLNRQYELEHLQPPTEEYIIERMTRIARDNQEIVVKVGSGFL